MTALADELPQGAIAAGAVAAYAEEASGLDVLDTILSM